MQNKINDWMTVWVIAYYTLQEALRNRVLWIAFIFALIGIGLAAFIGDVAVVEHRAVEVSLLAAAYRFCAALVLMVLVVSTLVREFNDKCLELYLSLTISRLIYFIGKMSGFFLVAVLLSALFGGMLLLYAPPLAVLFWGISLVCELSIVAIVSVFCVMTFSQQIPAAFAAALLFYLMCRAADGIILISQSDIILHVSSVSVMKFIIEKLLFLLPSLGRFTQTEWLAYADVDYIGSMPAILLQTVIYVGLIGAATMFDLSRKNI